MTQDLRENLRHQSRDMPFKGLTAITVASAAAAFMVTIDDVDVFDAHYKSPLANAMFKEQNQIHACDFQ